MMLFRLPRLLSLVVACLVAASCVGGGFRENPLVRTVGWFSYVGGDDLRKACPGAVTDRYRFVYNAIYTEQVRTYDLTLDPGGGSAGLVSRVMQPPSGITITIDDPLESWRGVIERSRIDRASVLRLERALAESGVMQPVPAGLRLRSDNFYWVVSSCVDGTYHLNAFQAPTQRFASLVFPSVLFDLDPTDVPVNAVRELIFGASEPTLEVDRSATREIGFVLQVGRDGLLR